MRHPNLRAHQRRVRAAHRQPLPPRGTLAWHLVDAVVKTLRELAKAEPGESDNLIGAGRRWSWAHYQAARDAIP